MKFLPIFLLAIPWFLSSCTPSDGGKTQVVATTTMVADMADALLKDVEGVELTGLMAPGVDPHTYNLPARSIAKLDGADVILYSGLKLEGRTEELYQSRAGNAIVLEVAGSIPSGDLLMTEDFEGYPDPHVWGDPRIWLKCIDAMVAALSEKLPEDRGTIERNGDAYRQELVELHHWAALRTSQIPEDGRTLITSHDAFNYFGKAYGLEVIGIQGISTESEASGADMSKAAELIQERGVKAIFVESSVNGATIERLANDTDAKIGGELFSDSLGPAGEEKTVDGQTYDVGTYVGMLKHNINTIVEALQ
ncbi:MAG: zinc ABC transporter substrate-binding protein [Verrucomicrobiota bacterium]